MPFAPANVCFGRNSGNHKSLASRPLLMTHGGSRVVEFAAPHFAYEFQPAQELPGNL
jgi:hypothetical protein